MDTLTVSVKLSVWVFGFSFFYLFQYLLSLTELNSVHWRNESVSITINWNHCSYGLCNSRYNANELHHPSSLAWNWKFYDVRLHIYCVCVGVCPSMSCTRRITIECRWRLYNENWDTIYSVSVVNFFVLFFSIFFGYH